MGSVDARRESAHVHGSTSDRTLSHLQSETDSIILDWIHPSPLPAIQLITVNQVIKPLNVLPQRPHAIERNQDFLPVLPLWFRENQTDISEIHQGS